MQKTPRNILLVFLFARARATARSIPIARDMMRCELTIGSFSLFTDAHTQKENCIFYLSFALSLIFSFILFSPPLSISFHFPFFTISTSAYHQWRQQSWRGRREKMSRYFWTIDRKTRFALCFVPRTIASSSPSAWTSIANTAPSGNVSPYTRTLIYPRTSVKTKCSKTPQLD